MKPKTQTPTEKRTRSQLIDAGFELKEGNPRHYVKVYGSRVMVYEARVYERIWDGDYNLLPRDLREIVLAKSLEDKVDGN